jgi:hypothetical protein
LRHVLVVKYVSGLVLDCTWFNLNPVVWVLAPLRSQEISVVLVLGVGDLLPLVVESRRYHSIVRNVVLVDLVEGLFLLCVATHEAVIRVHVGLRSFRHRTHFINLLLKIKLSA